MKRLSMPFAIISMAFVSSACQLERMFPEQVAMGVARLSVRNLGTLVSAVVADSTCGFSSQAAAAGASFEGELGRGGVMTVAIDECVLDFGKLYTFSTDCKGVETAVGGKVKISGVQRVRGQLTGNPASPVIPGGADAVEIQLRAEFSGFQVRSSDADNGLVIQSGRVSWTAKPHLGVDTELGLCSVATRDLSLEQIRYQDAVLQVDSGDGPFPVEVPRSDFSAQVGKWGDRENDLKGTVQVWDKEVAVPTAEDNDGLDPEYKREAFLASFTCDPTLKTPVSYTCGNLDDTIAMGTARLTVAAFGVLADFLDEETTCGFASDAQLDAQQVSGELGRRGGRVRLDLDQACTLTFSADTVIKQDCNGVSYLASGSMTATGYKQVDGINTGSRATPIVPTTMRPSVVELSLGFTDFTLRRSDMPYSMTIISGTLTGTVVAQLGLDTATQTCSIKSSAVSLTDIALRDADVKLVYQGNAFRFQVDDTELDGVNGRVDSAENTLSGHIIIDGVKTVVSPSGPAPLDPEYDADRFIASDACLPNYQRVTSDSVCDPDPMLANAVARLLVQATGNVASMVNADTSCGFEDKLGVLLWPSDVQGEDGEMGSITWDVQDCVIDHNDPSLIKEDCQGTRTMAVGEAKIDAARTVSGERETQLVVVASVVPRDPNAVKIVLQEVNLYEFSVYDLPRGMSAPPVRLDIASGTLSGTVEPILGENSEAPGTFDVATPIAIFNDVRFQGTTKLRSGDLTFAVDVQSADVDAMNGFYQGHGNYIVGSVKVNGTTVQISQGPLNPDYTQQAFDASYQCIENLMSTVPVDG